MSRFADDIDVTLLALVSHLQHRLFLLEGKTAPDAERLTRRVVSLAYHMAFGGSPDERTHASIERAAERILSAVRTLEEVLADEEREADPRDPPEN